MKKLLTIIALSLVAVIGATIITLAFVKTNYGQVPTSNIDEVIVTYNSKSGTFDEENYEEIYSNLLSKFDAGVKETMLSSLFQGAYSANAKAEITKASWTESSVGSTYVKFNYNESNLPTITLNGEEYVDETLTTTDKTVEYSAVYVTVVNSSALTTVTAYFVHTLNNTSTNSGNYKITFVAHLDGLYDYITSLSEDGYLL